MPAEIPVTSIPTVVWSGIVAAGISLAGVVLSNWSTTSRLRIQLGHDSTEKLRDRLATLRREVYLQLYTDLVDMQGHLGGLAHKDPASPDFATPVQTVVAQLSKVQLVGGLEAMRLASELTARVTESLFELMIAAKPMHKLRIDMRIAEKFYDEFLQEFKRINSEIASLLESGRPDHERMAALQRSLEVNRRMCATYSQQRDDAGDAFALSQAHFFEAVKSQIGYISPVQAQLLAALKNEIGVPTDSAELLAEIESSQERMERAAQKVMSALAD